MIAYHYTLQTNVDSILDNGLLTGNDIGKGEKINAILLNSNKYRVTVGNFAYLMVDLTGLNYRMINDSWIECYETITPNRILAIAKPPTTNVDAITLYNTNKDDWNYAFAYQPITPKVSYIDCSVYITTIGKYVEKIIINYIDGKQKVCSFDNDTFTDDNLISLLQQLQSDNNVTAYNVQYW